MSKAKVNEEEELLPIYSQRYRIYAAMALAEEDLDFEI